MHESNNEITPDTIASWLFSNNTNSISKTVGYLGYFMSLASSVFMATLTKDYIEQEFGWSKTVAYILGVFSAIPLSILLAQQSKNALSTSCKPPDPNTNELYQPRMLEQNLISNFKKTFRYALAITVVIPITYLSHQQILEKTGNIVLAIILDIFAFVPRWFLFGWAIESSFARFSRLISHASVCFSYISSSSNDQNPSKKEKILNHLKKTMSIVQLLPNNEIQQLSNQLNTANEEEKLKILLRISQSYSDEHYDKKSYLLNWIFELTALFIGGCASYTILQLGLSAYADINQLSDNLSIIGEMAGECAAWIGSICFTSLIHNATTIAFNRFYYTLMQFINDSKQSIQQSSSIKENSNYILPPILAVIAIILAVVSVFPRVQMNNESFPLTLNEEIALLINVVSGIGYFSLDVWPLNDWLQQFSSSKNIRKSIENPIIKLIKGVTMFNENTINTLKNLLPVNERTGLLTNN